MKDIKEAITSVLDDIQQHESIPLSRRVLSVLSEIEKAQHAGVPLYAIAEKLHVPRASFYDALHRARAYAKKHDLHQHKQADRAQRHVQHAHHTPARQVDADLPAAVGAKQQNPEIPGFENIMNK